MGIISGIFEKGNENALMQFCNEMNGTYIEGHYGEQDGVAVTYEKWKIVIDTYILRSSTSHSGFSAEYIRVRVSFIQKENFKFSIAPKDLLSSIGKIFGFQDIEIGYPDFDNAFIIKGNDENKIRLLFSNNKIREIISLQKGVRLEITDTEGQWGEVIPEGVSQLYLFEGGVINNIEQLKVFYALFCELLDELSKICYIIPYECS